MGRVMMVRGRFVIWRCLYDGDGREIVIAERIRMGTLLGAWRVGKIGDVCMYVILYVTATYALRGPSWSPVRVWSLFTQLTNQNLVVAIWWNTTFYAELVDSE
jgi:hypothetical protein